LISCFAHTPYAYPFIEPHWFSFSSIGFFWIVAEYFKDLQKRIRMALWCGALAVVLLSWWVLLAETNDHWQNEETYCRFWIARNPYNITPYYGLGKSLNSRGEFAQAEQVLLTGIQINGYPSPSYMAELGYANLMMGRVQIAGDIIRNLLVKEPANARIHGLAGEYFVYIGQFQQAENAYLNALQFYPGHKPFEIRLAQIRHLQKAGL
jgi:tetratricopeptide (TPR) repeat protein